MRRRRIAFSFSVACLLLAWPASGAGREEVKIRVRILSPGVAEVTASVDLGREPPGANEIPHIAIRFPGQKLEILTARSDSHLLSLRSYQDATAWRFGLQLPDRSISGYEIGYRLVSSGSERRLPLLLPSLAPEGGSYCDIQVWLPDDWGPAGESFPSFEWDGRTMRAALSNLPSFILVAARSERELGFYDRWVTVGTTTNALLLIFIVAALGMRSLLARRSRPGDAGAAGQPQMRGSEDRPCK